MILPDKNIRLEYSLLNCGRIILECMIEPNTISGIWDRVKKNEALINYEKFLLTLDVLYVLNAIDYKNGLLMRCKNDSLNKK